MARDARGNKLKVGDTVSLEIPSRMVVGGIQTLTQGGIVTGMRGGGQQVTTGKVVVLVAFHLDVDPTHDVLNNVQKLHTEEAVALEN